MREVTPLFAAVELLRKRVNKDMPIQHLTLLLAVAETPGITMPELMAVLKMPQGTVSRNVKTLSAYLERENGVAVIKGYNLLRTEPDPANRRVLAVYLTQRGEALIGELTKILKPCYQDEKLPRSSMRVFDYPALGAVEALAQ